MKKIILIVVVFIILLLPLGCSSNKPAYEVLANSLSININNESSFAISPSKVHINKACYIPITVSNFSGKPIELVISVIEPNSNTEGYRSLGINDEYRVKPYKTRLLLENQEIYVTSILVEEKIGIGNNKLESWVSFAEVTDKQVLTALCMKILIR